MADRKRKVASATADQPSKKSRKSSDKSITADSLTSDLVQPLTSSKRNGSKTDDLTKPQRTRKRATDFMSDEEEVKSITNKKSKKSSSRERRDELLSADGINGVIEHEGNEEAEIETKKQPVATSMMAEAERTADQELEDEFGEDSEEDEEELDHAPALLTGFDSDTEDVAEDKDIDTSRTAPIPQFKKTSKKLRKAAGAKSEGPGAVYVGRIPHGFYEREMREYFSQFGTITKLRLSRNKQTGASKHFAFIEFESEEVAKIVAETMDNYLMFGHILKCKFAPADSLHPDVWKGANKTFRPRPDRVIERKKERKPKTEAEWEKKITKEQQRRDKKAKQLKSIGYEFKMPKLAKPSTVLEQRKLEAEKTEPVKTLEESKETPQINALEKQKEAKTPSMKNKEKKTKKDTPLEGKELKSILKKSVKA